MHRLQAEELLSSQVDKEHDMTKTKPKTPQGPLAGRLRSLPGAAVVVAMAGTMALTACGGGSTTAGSTGAASPQASSVQAAIAVDEKVASLVPAEYKGKTLTVAFEVANLPWSDFTEDKKSFQGLNYDLVEAVTSVLGLEANYEGTSFTNLIPGVQGGRYDIVASGIFDTPAREEIVDAVTYSSDGEMLIGKKGGKTELTADTLCGLKVAVTASNVMAEKMPSRSDKCVSEGKQAIAVQVYPTQSEMYLSVSSGRADVLATASSNGGYLIKTNPNAFQQAGPTYDSVPVAMVIKKDSPLSDAVAAAVNKLIEDGTYAQIFDKWGQTDSAVKESKINPATAK